MENKKSVFWINAIRAICIIFVYFSHCKTYYGCDGSFSLINAIYLPFSVNAFFFVSGYLLLGKQLSVPKIDETRSQYIVGGGRILLLNIINRILIPSVIFASIEFLPKKLIRGESIYASDMFYETIGGLTYWFTGALVVAELLFLLLFITRIRNVWFYVVCAVVLSSFGAYLASNGFYFVADHPSFPWLYKNGLICTVYLAMGGLYWRYEPFCRDIKSGLLIFLTAIYCIGCIFLRPYLVAGNLTSMEQINPLGALWSVFASILLIEILKKVPQNKILTFIGQNSIGFYFMSGALPIVVSIVMHKIIPHTYSWMVFIIMFICLTIAYYTMHLLNRFCPWLFDLRLIRRRDPAKTN